MLEGISTYRYVAKLMGIMLDAVLLSDPAVSCFGIPYRSFGTWLETPVREHPLI